MDTVQPASAVRDLAAATAFPTLFSPVRLGPAVSRNRVMRVATTSNLAERNRVGERMLAFYRTVAEGGAGVVVSEAVRLHPADAVVPAAIPLFDRGAIAGLRRISDAIHRAGALFVVQLNHGGRQHLGRRVGTLLAPSAIACPRSGGVPHALTTREVEEMVECYVAAALNAREAGADGVEVHGAQGHLIGQFVSPFSNRREDRYGGSLDNRLRFPTEILESVRRRIGPRAVVGYRMGVEEFTPGGVTIEDACEMAARLVRAGLIDYLSLSQGNFNTIETHLPDRHWPQAAYRGIQRQVMAAVGGGTAVVQSTRIQTPEQAEDILAAGDGDMVGLCRALIVDPEWPEKARTGRAGEIRRCIACNQCWDWISSAEPIGCTSNPLAGREHQFGPLKRAVPGKVLVVGGGPAGLEAARVAAERGHRVVLYERAADPGGKFAAAHLLPHAGELRHLLDFQVSAARRAGVELRLGVEATALMLLAEEPHAVIVAAERGHRVVLYERAAEPGGKFAAAHLLPHAGELRHLLDFQVSAARRAGVEFSLGVEATAPMLLAEEPHAVIVAAGAEPVAPDLPGDGSVPVIAPCSLEDMARVPERAGAKLLLMDEDGYFWAAAIAEAAAAAAARAGSRLVVATRFFEPFRELPMVSRIATLRALDRAGAEFRTSMAPVRLEAGSVMLQHYLTGREEAMEDCAALLWVGAQRARGGLYQELRDAGLERTHLVGDAFAPRRVAVALVEAQTVARAI